MVSSSETKSPRPHAARAPGRRRWNSSGKAADVAGGRCPSPGSADASPAPRLQARSPPGELAPRSVLLPSGRRARFSQRGVNSSWVVPQRKAQKGEKMCLPTPVLQLGSSQASRGNQSIPARPRAGQCEGRALGLPAATRRWPRPPETPGANRCQGNGPDHEGILGLGGEVVKGRWRGRCPARAGLHRPLLGKRESYSTVPAGTSHVLGVRVGVGVGVGLGSGDGAQV